MHWAFWWRRLRLNLDAVALDFFVEPLFDDGFIVQDTILRQRRNGRRNLGRQELRVQLTENELPSTVRQCAPASGLA